MQKIQNRNGIQLKEELKDKRDKGDKKQKNQVKHSHPKNMNKSVIASGKYGCVVYPRIKCDGVTNHHYREFVSKIALDDFFTNNEYSVSMKIKSHMARSTPKNGINNHDEMLDRFVLIQSKCNVKRQHMDVLKSERTDIMEQCKMIKKRLSTTPHDDKDGKDDDNDPKKSVQFVLLKMKYIQSITAMDHLLNQFDMRKYLKYYYFSLKCIESLQTMRIIHRDLHPSNIIIQNGTDKFYLIDFGLSIDLDKVLPPNTEQINYSYLRRVLIKHDPSWKFHSIEDHMLSFYVFHNRHPTRQDIQNIVEKYYSMSNVVMQLYISDMNMYRKRVLNYMIENYVENSNEYTVDDQVRKIINESSHTWDLYRVNYITLYLMSKFKIQNMNNFFSLSFSFLHYDYTKRPKNMKSLIHTFINIIKYQNLLPSFVQNSEDEQSKSVNTELRNKRQKMQEIIDFATMSFRDYH